MFECSNDNNLSTGLSSCSREESKKPNSTMVETRMNDEHNAPIKAPTGVILLVISLVVGAQPAL